MPRVHCEHEGAECAGNGAGGGSWAYRPVCVISGRSESVNVECDAGKREEHVRSLEGTSE